MATASASTGASEIRTARESATGHAAAQMRTQPCTETDEHMRGTRDQRPHNLTSRRYDDVDFDDYAKVMRGLGLWLVDSSPDYRSNRPF